MLRYAALLDNSMIILHPDMSFEAREVATCDLTQLADYVLLADHQQLDQLWFYPGTDVSHIFDNATDAFVSHQLHGLYSYRRRDRDLKPSMVASNAGGPDITIVFPEYIRICEQINEPESPEHLLIFLAGIEALLGVPFQVDDKSTGIALLEKSLGGAQWEHFDRDLFYRNPIDDRSFHRTITDEEVQEYSYYHTIDMNSAYFASCNNLPTATGRHTYGTTQFDPQRQGLWQVEVLGDDPFECAGVPKGLLKSGWQPTLLVAMAYRCGYDLCIHDSYLAEDSTLIMQGWYEEICRAMDRDTEGWIKPFIKVMRNSTLGLMKVEPKEGHKVKWYSRPDIRSNVVARCIVRMYEAIVYLIQEGHVVTYMSTDTLGYLSKVPFKESLPSKVKISSNVGEFKYTGSSTSAEALEHSKSSTHMHAFIEGGHNNGK